QYVLQGSVQKQAARWRVSVQLYDSATRRMVFSDKHECARQDIFQLQDEIAARIAEQLERRFPATTRKARDRYSADPIAYDAFMLWSQANGFQHREGILHLQTGLALQSNLPHAHNRLGTIYVHVGLLPEAAAMYQKGRRLDPRNQAAHGIAQVYVWGGEYDLA